MRGPQTISDNLRFLLVEVAAQVSDLRTALDTGSVALARRVLDRSGYADNLKMRIRDGCLDAIRRGKKRGAAALYLRAMEVIAIDLDRIALLCRDCARQYDALDKRIRSKRREHAPLLRRVEQGIGLVERATECSDMEIALKITRIKPKIDSEYRRLLRTYTFDLRKGKNPEPVITAIFMAQRIEEMGGALLDIGDAIISANLGQQMSADRYHSLSATMEKLNGNGETGDLTAEPLAQTRSGSAISGISDAGADDDRYIAVFKDGKRRKLKEERDKVDRWNEIYPGLAPKILSYYKRDDSAALLIEHLPGLTFEHILLHEKPELLAEALKHLEKTLRAVWKKTRTKKVVPALYMRQLSKRIEAVYGVHGDFRNDGMCICGHRVPSFGDLVGACEAREAKIKIPFSVHIHGDFNTDNILFDADEGGIRFIDLHRSQYMDYVQDVSVFMVSNYRLQALDAPHRRRVAFVILAFYDFARRFAAKIGDDTFQIRLALGLARSLATSTRFILDKTLANKMFIRSRFLMERVLESDPKKPHAFSVPIEELFIG